MNRIILFVLLLSIHVITVAVTQPDLSSSQSIDIQKKYNTIGQLSLFLKEQDYNLSLEQARQAYAKGKFKPSNQAIPSFSVGSPAVWMRISINNLSSLIQSRWLIIDVPWMDYIDSYVIDHNGKISSFRGGDARPLSVRPVKARIFKFKYHFKPGTSVIYIRVQTNEPLILPVYLETDSDFEKDSVLNAYHYGLLYGVITGLLFFNLLIYFSIRQKRYLYYVFYLAMYLLMDFSYTAHGYMYIWQDAILFQKWMTTISITIYSTAGILFALAFLRVKKLFPVIYNNTLRFISVFLFIQLILVIFDFHAANIILSLSFVSFYSLFTFYLAIICFKKGSKDAVYYLVAIIATLFGAATTVFAVTGIVPYNYFTYHAGEIAVAFDAILLSIALAEQIRRAQNEKTQAQQLARTDSLTKVSNRLAFEEASQAIWHNVVTNNLELCFIMLDLDHFKKVNDEHGHTAGDEVLINISRSIKASIRNSDMLVRWGGEEFAIILPNTSLEQAKLLAERIRSHIEDLKIRVGDETIAITVSLGVSQKVNASQNMHELFSEADKALYEAKQHGRNRVCVYYNDDEDDF